LLRYVALLAGLVLVLSGAACGDDDDGDSAGGTDDPKQVAWINAGSANTFLQAARKGMDGVAAENDIEITEFDAQFDPELQQRQLRDAITSGKYEGIILTALVGPALIPDVKDAIDKGIEVVILNQIVGDDLTTSEPQVEGVAASVASPPAEDGKRLGEATVLACEGVNPCRVVYFFGEKGIPFDQQVRAGLDKVIGTHANIRIAAEGESGFEGPDKAFTQMQDILVKTPEFEVVVGADQAMAGAELALKDAKKSGVKLIASGGSKAAVTAITEGRWFAGVFAAPRTEGELAMKAMAAALDGKETGGVDAIESFPGNGIITKENVSQFEAQWEG
jgi:ribose transport system substrate-binding protein